MSKIIDALPVELPEEMSGSASVAGRLPSDASSRRRILLKSLGKGSAVVVAAASPLQLLAGVTTISGTNLRCSVSGQHSGVHSQTVGGNVCTAHSPGYWHKCDHWLNKQFMLLGPGAGYPSFDAIFGPPNATNGSVSMLAIITSIGNGPNLSSCPTWQNAAPPIPVTNLPFNDTAVWHWACAWMNAVAGTVNGSGIMNFPYTSDEVIALYQGTNSANALLFFKSIEGVGFGGPGF